MTVVIFILLVISFGIGNVYRLTFFTPELRISILDFTMGIIWLIYLLKFRFHIAPLTKPILLFGLVALISLLFFGTSFGTTPTLVGLVYLIRWLLYSLFFIPITHLLPKKHFTSLLLSLLLLTVGICMFQYLVFPDIRPLAINNWDEHYYRVVGQFLDPGFTGILLVFFLAFIVLTSHLQSRYKITLWLFTYLALALTYSRASYLAFLFSSLYIAWYLKRVKYLLFCILLFLITLVTLPRPGGEGVRLERTSTVSARLTNWSNAISIFAKQPILGVGFNVYRYAQLEAGFAQDTSLSSHADAGSDSSLLFVAATTGLVGLFVYIFYLKRLLFLNHPWLLAALLPLLVHSWFLNSLFYPPVMLWLSLLITYSHFYPSRISRPIRSHKN